MALLLPVVLMIYQLAGFHTMLIIRGITTYEYICMENNKERAKKGRKLTVPLPKSNGGKLTVTTTRRSSSSSSSSPTTSTSKYTITRRTEAEDVSDLSKL